MPPPRNLAAPLDIRGDFTGDSLGSLEKWRGQIFTQLDYADIAAWRPWLPFPEKLNLIAVQDQSECGLE